VRGKLSSFQRLLGSFVSIHANDASAIQSALTNNQRADAERMAHSLKGTSATLGLFEIHEAARELESALHQTMPTAQINARISRLDDLLARSSDALTHLFASLPATRE
jgi:HPt (histidine-containing phosphotransfer) domain-containing protein